VIYSYNKSQRDALFLKFILIKNSTCFGQIYCPSSGVSALYTQQVMTSLAGSKHKKHDKYLLLCIQCWDSWWRTVDLSQNT